MVAIAVNYDVDRQAWTVEYESGQQVHYSTEDEAWEHSGLPRPPGRYPITDKDYE